ncbi:uncharacterized mitochondrial protein AtMg00810-like [Rutidosis leptorrhynchoides]|uniref:uncharacterized mitochondrial protein AtMg00810-like n=1 Tax=Rutidosis leptorrhynchoides TaxID=125765 RepID=UPI003A9A62F4
MVNRSTSGLFLNQTAYARDIIQRAGMTSCNPVSTPIDTKGKQSAKLGNLYSDPTYYPSIAAALQYLTFTHSDISYVVYLGNNLISWSSKIKPIVSRSSAEAEYRGIANVVAESCWLRNLLLELTCSIMKATVVFCDNVSAIYLSGNPVQYQQTKHIRLDIHFVREKSHAIKYAFYMDKRSTTVAFQ